MPREKSTGIGELDTLRDGIQIHTHTERETEKERGGADEPGRGLDFILTSLCDEHRIFCIEGFGKMLMKEKSLLCQISVRDQFELPVL